MNIAAPADSQTLSPSSDATSRCPFTEDYFLRGPETGLSNFENYSWKPQLTIPVCKLIMKYLGAQPGESVLDWGCARGYYVKALLGLGYEAWGYDVSEWAIENCDPEVKRFVSNNAIQPAVTSVDYILAKDVLEHICLAELGAVISGFIEMTRKAALIIVPLAPNGDYDGHYPEVPHRYVSPIDQADTTHKIAWTLSDWLLFIQGAIDASGRAFTVSGSYKMPGVKRAADPYPCSCGFFVLKRFEYE